MLDNWKQEFVDYITQEVRRVPINSPANIARLTSAANHFLKERLEYSSDAFIPFKLASGCLVTGVKVDFITDENKPHHVDLIARWKTVFSPEAVFAQLGPNDIALGLSGGYELYFVNSNNIFLEGMGDLVAQLDETHIIKDIVSLDLSTKPHPNSPPIIQEAFRRLEMVMTLDMGVIVR